MSNFNCPVCNTALLDSSTGYTTGCAHYPLEPKDDIVYRLRRRAEIRRSIPRGEPDRISDLLEEAAKIIEELR